MTAPAADGTIEAARNPADLRDRTAATGDHVNEDSVCDLSRATGQRLSAARRKRGLSQAGLAKLAGIAPPLVSLLEGGQRNFTFPMLERIAAALGCEPAELLREAGAPSAHEEALTLIAEALRKVL